MFTRREMLVLAAGVAGVATRTVAAPVPELAEAITRFSRGATPQPGRITLTIPEAIENGGAVPVTLEVASPMTEADHVEAVSLLAPDNPLVGLFSCGFTPQSGQARVTTRVRLGRSQTVIALARMRDGTVWIDRRPVTVTIGGCGS